MKPLNDTEEYHLKAINDLMIAKRLSILTAAASRDEDFSPEAGVLSMGFILEGTLNFTMMLHSLMDEGSLLKMQQQFVEMAKQDQREREEVSTPDFEWIATGRILELWQQFLDDTRGPLMALLDSQ